LASVSSPTRPALVDQVRVCRVYPSW
jgi:hypothetical protein